MSNPEDHPEEVEETSAEIEESAAPVETQEGQETIETESLENMILSTGIRVGTPVKTKFMAPFILKANPEELTTKIASVQDHVKSLEKELVALKSKLAAGQG